MATSGNAPGEKESVELALPGAGTYVLRVVNFEAVSPTYELTASLYDVTTVGTSQSAG